MTRSACLIFNPVAGQGDPEQDLQLIRTLLEPEIDLEVCQTTEDIDADELAHKAVERGAEMIIASGGDGTLSAAATALVNTKIPFGVISRGTANAFAHALGIPDNIEAACATILGGATRTVDTAVCNGIPMVLLTGIGFEAEMVIEADREAKNRFGVLAYIMAGFKRLRQLEQFKVKIQTDEKEIQVTAGAITIANAAPPTSILAQGPAGIEVDDGLLDVTIVAPTNMAEAIAAGYHLLQTALRGDAVERQDIGYIKAKRLTVETTPPQKVVVDGELIGTTPIEIECIPNSLTLLVPAKAAEGPVERLDGLPDLIVLPKNSDTPSV